MRFNTKDIILQEGGIVQYEQLSRPAQRMMNVTDRRISRFANRNNMSGQDVQTRFNNMGYVDPYNPSVNYDKGFYRTAYPQEAMYNNPSMRGEGQNKHHFAVDMPNSGYRTPISVDPNRQPFSTFQRNLRRDFRTYQEPITQQDPQSVYFKMSR